MAYESGTQDKSSVTRQISLGACSKDQWTKFGQSFSNYYDQLGLQTWLCPLKDQNFSLAGRYSADIFKYLKISIKSCSGTKNSYGCMNQQSINNYITLNEAFYFNFYFVNSLLNPHSEIPKTIFLEDTIQIPFSLTQGTTSNLYLNWY